MSYLPSLSLNEALEFCLYISYKTIVRLNLLAQAAAETEKDYHGQTKNAVPINAKSIKESQSTDTIDGNNLIDCSSIPPISASMEVVRKSLGFFSKFDKFRCKWQPLNKKKTTHALALKSKTGLAQLWFISITKYAGLIIGKYDGWTIKIKLSEENYTKLKRRLIQYGILSFV